MMVARDSSGRTRIAKVDKAVAAFRFYAKKARRDLDELSAVIEIPDKDKIFIGAQTALLNAGEVMAREIVRDGDEALGKLPPQAREMEEAVLGALMLEKSALPMVIKYLKPEHFYHEHHKEIYMAILALHEASEPVDMRLVVSQLRKTGKLELVGGAFTIADLTSKVSSSANIEFHAHVMIEMSIKRTLISACSAIYRDCYDDTTDCFELLDFAEETIKNIREWTK